MHEWALAESVVLTVLKAAEKEKLIKLTRIKIKVGFLQQIEKDIFLYALKDNFVIKNPSLGKVDIEIEEEPAEFECRVCGERWHFSESKNRLKEDNIEAIHFIPEMAHIYVRCPYCSSPDFEIIKGRGVSIDYIEGE